MAQLQLRQLLGLRAPGSSVIPWLHCREAQWHQKGAQNPRDLAGSWEWGAQTLLCPFSATFGLTSPTPNLASLPGIFWDLPSQWVEGLGSTPSLKNKRWNSRFFCLRIPYPASPWELLPPSRFLSGQTWDSEGVPAHGTGGILRSFPAQTILDSDSFKDRVLLGAEPPQHSSLSPGAAPPGAPDPCRPPPPKCWALSIYFHSKPVLRVAGGDMQGRHRWRGGL